MKITAFFCPRLIYELLAAKTEWDEGQEETVFSVPKMYAGTGFFRLRFPCNTEYRVPSAHRVEQETGSPAAVDNRMRALPAGLYLGR